MTESGREDAVGAAVIAVEITTDEIMLLVAAMARRQNARRPPATTKSKFREHRCPTNQCP